MLRVERDAGRRRSVRRSQAVHAVGMALTGAVLLVVLVTNFLAGAWIAVVAMAVCYATMRAVRRHYDRVDRELRSTVDQPGPLRSHAIVLVSQVHLPTLRALAYARATRPDSLTALTVEIDAEETRRLLVAWADQGLEPPLTVVPSPYREITTPIVDYVAAVRAGSPDNMVTVSSPSTSSAVGGSTCCTTSPRCGSRAGCSSRLV